MITFMEFLRVLPELIKLFQVINKENKMYPERDLKNDIKKITKAMEEHDDKTLTDLFGSIQS
jgi:hypothetical protein